MITEARLRVLARERKLRVDIVEKDYANSWLLYGLFSSRTAKDLAFKGGTALSKLYFPKVWRFSEDLDFTALRPVSQDDLAKALGLAASQSGIAFELKSYHENPGYFQAKVQYSAVLRHKNTTALDVSLQEPVLFPLNHMSHSLEDIPAFTLQAYSIEEIFVEKLRSLFQRARARDYYDLYNLIRLHKFPDKGIRLALEKKCAAKGIECQLSRLPDKSDVEQVKAYWDTALERLAPERPEFDVVLTSILEYIRNLESI